LYYGLEDDVLFNCKSVVYLILEFRFTKNIKIFYCTVVFDGTSPTFITKTEFSKHRYY